MFFSWFFHLRILANELTTPLVDQLKYLKTRQCGCGVLTPRGCANAPASQVEGDAEAVEPSATDRTDHAEDPSRTDDWHR